MIKSIYRLLHEYSDKKNEQGEPLVHTIELGYFSSRKKVGEVIDKYKCLKGFRDYSVKCFKIKIFFIFVQRKPTKLFELYHSYIDKSGYEEFKYLGVYASENKAEKKKYKLIKRYKVYREHPEGFEITEEFIDSENSIWSDGFDRGS